VQHETLVIGSTAILGELLNEVFSDVPASADVVVVPTAAAFTGAPAAAMSIVESIAGLEVRVEALMVTDRASSAEPYFVERIATADVVVLSDGSPLHARAVWRDSPVGEALRSVTQLVAVGAVASALGDVMIDPRGGAPTTGLGYRLGVVLTSPASDEQLARTRTLLGSDATLVVVGPWGAVVGGDGSWRVVRPDGVVITRGMDASTL